MSAPFEKKVRVFLEKGCEFRIGPRSGTVLDVRREGCVIYWAEWVDPKTGERHAANAGMLTHETVSIENDYGKLVVLSRPLAQKLDVDTVRRDQRTLREIARMQIKKAYIQVIAEKIASGEMRDVRSDFVLHEREIARNGKERHQEMVDASSSRPRRRSMARRKARPKALVEEYEYPGENGRTFFDWHRASGGGDDGLFDCYRNCGGASRFSEEVRKLVHDVIDKRLDGERPPINSIIDSVRAAVHVENANRLRQKTPHDTLAIPGHNYIRNQLSSISPIEYAIRGRGKETAYKDMHALGVGIKTSRALERVEIDEYTVDLMILLKDAGLFNHLTASERKAIGLDGSARRVILSAAIDVHTRCLLAFQIVPEGTVDPLKQTLEMIYTDKTEISDAVGCKFSWCQSGPPEEAVLDRGPKYVTNEAYAILAALGITNLGAPAGKPWLKPFIERVFKTIHLDLLARFPGRAFGNVVEKGENDPSKRAALGLDDFLFWLVRWIVDAYHNHDHLALGMSPMRAWEQAFKECEPRSISSQEMRLAFGTKTKRKVGRKGIRVMHIDYQIDEIAREWLSEGLKEVEVMRWPGDIGTICVREGLGDWITVSAADQYWIGKSDIDLRVWLASRNHTDTNAEDARMQAIFDIDEESYRLKKLCGLVSTPRSEDDLLKTEASFLRHMDTAERRHEFGEYDDLLANSVLPESSSITVCGPSHYQIEKPDDDTPINDLMD